MNSERRFTPGGEDKESRLAKVRQAERERVFNAYVHHFSLKEQDLMGGKTILDVGSGNLAAFADRARQLNLNCRVVSLDTSKFADVSSDGINQGNNLKIGETDFEGLNLKKKLGLRQEPRFDLILSHSSAPYTIANEESHVFINEQGVAQENLELLRNKMAATIKSAVDHLKVGGRAVFYPVFESAVIDFGPKAGGRRDFRAWRKVLDETLEALVSEENGYVFRFERMSEEGGHVYERLVIRRNF